MIEQICFIYNLSKSKNKRGNRASRATTILNDPRWRGNMKSLYILYPEWRGQFRILYHKYIEIHGLASYWKSPRYRHEAMRVFYERRKR